MTKTTAAWLQNNHRTFVLVALWLDNRRQVRQNFFCQGPWNVDLRTPPGPEGSNGSLLCVCRGHPDILSIQNEKCKIKNAGSSGCLPAAWHLPFFNFAFLIFNSHSRCVLSSNCSKVSPATFRRRCRAGTRHADARQRHRPETHRTRGSFLRAARHRQAEN